MPKKSKVNIIRRGKYDDKNILAYVVDANHADAQEILKKAVGDDTRSVFKWVQLIDGTLILGVFPWGNTFEEVSQNIIQ